ncbi:MAG: hypothetical protein CMC04_04720 [Flavobacteriaceae bacterium]|nr:hypothetical protein [Flavobacteriaceae bacterium]
MSVNSIKKFILFGFIVLLFIDPMNAQCSMCRAVLESEEGQQTAKGINNGIIYLMAIPYILVALASWRIYKIYRK